jgi:hypothetical protein
LPCGSNRHGQQEKKMMSEKMLSKFEFPAREFENYQTLAVEVEETLYS